MCASSTNLVTPHLLRSIDHDELGRQNWDITLEGQNLGPPLQIPIISKSKIFKIGITHLVNPLFQVQPLQIPMILSHKCMNKWNSDPKKHLIQAYGETRWSRVLRQPWKTRRMLEYLVYDYKGRIDNNNYWYWYFYLYMYIYIFPYI